jgi:hypothetical protein
MSDAVTSNGTLRNAAADQYRASVEEGTPLSAAKLGEQHGRSRTWARSVIAEVAAAGGSDGSQEAAIEPEPAAPVEPEAATGQPDAVSEEFKSYTRQEVPPWVGWVTVAAVLAVALAAGVASVDHLAALARLAGTTGWKAWLLPVAVDGLATAAALTLYRSHRVGTAAGWLPWLALGAGLAASVAGNVASVYPELIEVGTLKIAVGATPPLSLALSVELALRQVRGT